jgi:PAS domain S-box-containing protein
VTDDPIGTDPNAASPEHLLRAVVDCAPGAVFVKDADGRYLEISPAGAAMLGRSRIEVLGRTDAELLPAAVAGPLRRQDLQVMERGEAETVAETLGSGESARVMLTTKVPLRDEAGRVVGVVGYSREASAMAAALEETVSAYVGELEDALADLRQQTDRAAAAVVRADRAAQRTRLLSEAGRKLHASLDHAETLQALARLLVPDFCDWCGVYLLDDEGALQVVEVAHGDPGREQWARELLRRYPPNPDSPYGAWSVVRSGEPQLLAELDDAMLEAIGRDAEHARLLRAAGMRSAMSVPIPLAGSVIGAISLVSSDPERRYEAEDLELAEELGRRAAMAVQNSRLYEESQRASRAKSEFLATMSHELRTPLNAIMGYADLLQLGVGGEEKRDDHIGRIKFSAWHLLSLIEQILTFSRLEAGREEVTSEAVDAAELAREAMAMLEPLARDKGLELERAIPDGPLPIRSDKPKLRQILLNLLSNAVKFTQSGSVRVEVRAARAGVEFRVADTGPGIAEADRERIFEAFWQVDRATTRRSGGAGLGLSVVRQLTTLLGGTVSVQSEPGAGSTFIIRLPQEAPDMMEPPPQNSTATPAWKI